MLSRTFKNHIRSAGQPLFANLIQDGRDQPQAKGCVRKDRNDTRSAPDFAMETFQAVGGTQQTPEGDMKGNATASFVANVDSAIYSYTAWAKAAAAEASTVASATRSYIAQAKAVACGMDATAGLNLDSATRSYIAWAKSLEARKSCQ